MCEGNALLDIALQALHTSFQKSLLVVIDMSENVDGFLGTIGLDSFQLDSGVLG